MGASARPSGVRIHSRTESRRGARAVGRAAARARRPSSRLGRPGSGGPASARPRARGRRAPPRRSRRTAAAARSGRRAITESRISRCECPTTTTSGRTGSAASAAATCSPPTPVVSYEEAPSIPECTSATVRSASRRIASSTGAAAPGIGTIRTRPPLARSQTIAPGVVKPVTPIRTPCRRTTR